jgi:hypothetical protein
MLFITLGIIIISGYLMVIQKDKSSYYLENTIF